MSAYPEVIEETWIVLPGKREEPAIIRVAGAVISHAEDPISQFKFKNWSWAQDTFKRYGWHFEKVEESICDTPPSF